MRSVMTIYWDILLLDTGLLVGGLACHGWRAVLFPGVFVVPALLFSRREFEYLALAGLKYHAVSVV